MSVDWNESLVLVPFRNVREELAICDRETDDSNDIQLLPIEGSGLSLRGLAPGGGEMQKGLLRRGHILSLNDAVLQSINIDNRDAPAAKHSLTLAQFTAGVKVPGEQLLRFGDGWNTFLSRADVTSLRTATYAEGFFEFERLEIEVNAQWACEGSLFWRELVFTKGKYVYLPTSVWRIRDTVLDNFVEYQEQLSIAIFEMGDSEPPKPMNSISIAPSLISDSAGIVRSDNTLLLARVTDQHWPPGAPNIFIYEYDVLDLSNPAAPELVSHFEVPEKIARQGWGENPQKTKIESFSGWHNVMDVVVPLSEGNILVSQHAVPLDDGTGRVRYYRDRFNLRDPSNPKQLPEVSIPGKVPRYGESTGELLTLEVQGATYYLSSLIVADDAATRKSYLQLNGNLVTGFDSNWQIEGLAVSGDRVFFAARILQEEGGASPSGITRHLESLRLVDGCLERLPTCVLSGRRTRGTSC